jgi:hemolysin-activating ACP:hemolysin acyltransferase
MKTRAAILRTLQTEAMDVLKLAELDPAYAAATPADRIAMANLGAACWGAVKEGLFDQWAAAMSAEEGAKADVWRREGRLAAMEEVSGKLGVMEGMTARLAAADATIAQLRANVEAEVSVRVGQQMEVLRKEYELSAMKEVHALEKAIILAEERARHLPMYEQRLNQQAEDIAKLREQVHAMELENIQSSTKSSHVLGKMGEATVLDMLTNVVLPAFPYSTVKDVTHVSHSADFHLWIMTPQGRRVKFLVDSKNYTKTVNTEEIMKLYADVDADEEADCGMLVSLASGISKVRQFEVRTTDKHKPVIFLTFQDMEEDQRHKLLCWAITALVSVVKNTSNGDRNYILENIEAFLDGIMSSLNDVESMINAQTRLLASMRQHKADIIRKITNFRAEACLDAKAEDDILESSVTDGGGCVTTIKATGLRCGKSVFKGGNKCRHHTSRKDRVTTGPALVVEEDGE